MDIINEIIKEFFEKLSIDSEIPQSLIIELKNLWENEKLNSKPSVINSIKKVLGEKYED